MLNTIQLKGCSPVPLAHYLKALGVLRLVAEQADHEARGYWKNDCFHLQTKLTEKELVDFFLYKYCPTPIVAPWNGGSGFYPKLSKKKEENTDERSTKKAYLTVNKMLNSKTYRLKRYREVIELVKIMLKKLGYERENPTGKKKDFLIRELRNNLPDNVLYWFDTVVVLTRDKISYPGILGSGGNDGNCEFSNNFMQRLVGSGNDDSEGLIDPDCGNPTDVSESFLKESLFTTKVEAKKLKVPIGQFFPGSAGGVNSTRGFKGASLVNPWDFVLGLEGTLMFVSACSRKLNPESAAVIASPFAVETVAAGYASAALSDERGRRGELWAPLWEKPSTISELSFVFSEGRSEVGRRLARNGLDFASAAVSLGIDRGIVAFQRYSFQERNGKAYFAIPLKRVATKRNERVDLLSEIDRWLSRLIELRKNKKTPGAIRTILNKLDNTILELCENNTPERLQAVLIQLGRCEKVFAKSTKWATEKGLEPLQGLSFEWVLKSYTETAEFRLACSLASLSGRFGEEFIPLRFNLEPVEFDKYGGITFKKEGSIHVVWHEGDFCDVLNRIFARRLIDAEKSGQGELVEYSKITADIDDIMKFVNGETDDSLIADLLWGLCLIDWSGNESLKLTQRTDFEPVKPEALYALMKLCFMKAPDSDRPIPLIPAIHRHAAAGNSEEASKLAERRLRASEMAPAIERILLAGYKVRRMAAALIFPLSKRDWFRLGEAVLRPEEQQA
ncbi:MAG: type I-U CRISPR-associated protein Csx17 [Candidatus Sumerlaeia bacterium]|nr:type I-U CRISPR-associated protein Csx17 [Candidatus Sumerlaeia bacterium]